MDHASSLSNGQERPTVEDVIDWIEEEAFRMGRLGFRKGYANPQEIFSNFSMNGSVGDFEEMDRLEHCATTAMEGVNAELSLMERRMNIMNADPPLLARAEARVDRRLLEAGMSHKDIESYPKSEKRLREKVLALYTLKHPVTEPPPGIEAWVFLGRQRERQVSVLLPLKATLAEVCECLDGVCASQDFLSVGWNQTAAQNRERGRIWRYQLTVKGQMSTLAPQSTKLLEDIDYHHLIQQITKKEGGVYSYYAILSPDIPPEAEPSSPATILGDDDTAVDWNPLDKDGVPYFEPSIDWSKVKIDEATGEIKEADLDKVVRELNALDE